MEKMVVMPNVMNTDNTRSLWEKAQEALRHKLTEDELEDWFEDAQVLENIDGNVILGIPSGYRREYIEKNYHALLTDIFSELLDCIVDVEIRLSGSMGEEVKAQAPSSYAPSYSPAITSTEGLLEFEPLNASYTFDNFVVGTCNKMANAAAQAVAAAPAQSYNPLFVYGGVGLGKTHLMQAIGNKVQYLHPAKRVVYLSAEQFVNVFIDAIKRNARLSFQSTFRNVDVLLIDDIQFLAGKESTQEEFFHTFNALHNRRKQIVISSDRPPKDIPTIEDRLRSRFEWGLIVDITPPDFEMRMAILRKKCETEDMIIPDDILEFLASKVRFSIRELEGALAKITAYAKFSNENLNVETVGKVLGEIFDRPTKEVTIEKIQRKVAEYFSIKPSDIIGKNRSRSIARPRQIAMYLSRKLTQHSFPEIGAFFGNKDHTTVLFAYNKIEKEMEAEQKLRSVMEQITDTITNFK